MALPGSEGMVLLKYVEGKAGTMTFIGPVTGTPYAFGGSRVVGYVDVEDAEEFVNQLKHGKPIFRYYKAPKVKKEVMRDVEEVSASEAPEAVPVDILETTTFDEPVIGEEEYKLDDPEGMTIGELKEYILDLSAEDLDILLKAETEGKNRKGAIEAIEAALDVD